MYPANKKSPSGKVNKSPKSGGAAVDFICSPGDLTEKKEGSWKLLLCSRLQKDVYGIFFSRLKAVLVNVRWYQVKMIS